MYHVNFNQYYNNSVGSDRGVAFSNVKQQAERLLINELEKVL